MTPAQIYAAIVRIQKKLGVIVEQLEKLPPKKD